MAGEISTIQSLKAVDAWIDVINANINGGVRTGFKSSRLKFAGSNVDIVRAGTGTSLPLQMPEAGLTTANTIIDFSQGAVTASTENTHLAIQGSGFFLLMSPDGVDTTAGATLGLTKAPTSASKLFITRDGEFHTDANGLLVAANGYYLVTYSSVLGPPFWGPAQFGAGSSTRAIYNDLDNTNPPAAGGAVKLSSFLANPGAIGATTFATLGGAALSNVSSIIKCTLGMQSLQYSQFGSTVYDFGSKPSATYGATTSMSPNIIFSMSLPADATILSKSLEASNASMTQSVPELSLAQKLFSALTKVLQTKQTNIDGVLNLVR
jgi:flagellar hook protein FlgE